MITEQIGIYSIIAGRWPIDSSKPTLVFIHGAALSKGLWQYQIDELADMVNTIAIDLPGHGYSKGNGYDNISDYSISVNDFIESINAHKIVLCGLSMGGAVAQRLLIDHPEKFDAGILMHTGAKLKVMPLIFETITQDYHKYHEMMIQFALAREADKQSMAGILNNIVTWKPEVAVNDFYACDSFNVIDQLSRIKVPVLVITGDEDNITPHKYGEFLAINIPDSRLIKIQGAGHASPLEKPDAVNMALRDFLKGV